MPPHERFTSNGMRESEIANLDLIHGRRISEYGESVNIWLLNSLNPTYSNGEPRPGGSLSMPVLKIKEERYQEKPDREMTLLGQMLLRGEG